MDPLYYLMYATNEKISITQIEGNWPQGAFPTMEQREAFVKDWPQLPDDSWKQWLLEWEPRGEKAIPYFPTIDMCCQIVDWMEMLHNIDDACCVCAGMSSFCLKPPYHIHNYPRIISAATGLDLDEASLKKIVNRSRNLHRALNNRRGMSRKDEKPPQDHWKRRFPEIEENLMSAYYTFKGWNQDGVPTKERLNELDLGYVAEDLEKRGLLKDGQD
jgi:aldehyde:ferredoxin oxidoreductase